jgi:hypothetical protein
MNGLKDNGLGFALLAVGLAVVMLGHYTHIDKLADAGFGFLGMSALALSVKPAQSPKE